MSDQKPRCSMRIEWSNLDNAYIVSFPELERADYFINTHGATYAEAAQKGQELLADLMTWAKEAGRVLPVQALFDTHAYAPGETAEGIAQESQKLLREIETRKDAPAPSGNA